MKQLDLFAWADNKPSNIVDALPALLARIRIEQAYQIPRPACGAKIIPMESKVA